MSLNPSFSSSSPSLPPRRRFADWLPQSSSHSPSPSAESLLSAFLEAIEARNIALYGAQESAILELFEEKNVILNTPTGSGKSLCATALHFLSLGLGRRSVYTCPIKALVNEKWLALCQEFGPENVGLSTGDASVNRDAPILCCTAEVLANIALREGAHAPVHDVVMDEFHYYADPSRGVAWQIPLLSLPQTRFLLMSATLGDTAFFETALSERTKRPTTTVRSETRPVPLEFEYAETPLANTLEHLLQTGKAPVYVVHFTQMDAAQSAQEFTSLPVCTREEKAAISDALAGFRFTSPYGPEIRKWLRHGIGLHHAGLLPKYRILVETLAQRGLLKVICGTDTLGVGINVPIRSVLFTQLCKFSGQKTGILSARDFHQIAGRAGRKGFDNVGWVVAQAPAHAIENLQLEQKQAATGKKFVKRKPPERNFVAWDKQTFQRLIQSPPERLKSHFHVTHGMLLNVLSRGPEGPTAMRTLIRDSHEPQKAKRAHTKRAWQLFRSLLERGIIEWASPEAPHLKASLRVNATLQEDFSMNQALSLYLHDTLPLIDPQSPDYAHVVLTLVESILEDPEVILRKQLDKLKGQAVAEMKRDGLDYHQRLEELEKLEYPKPNRDFIYPTFNAFADRHPWVGSENIRPKSIVREMFEEYRSFSDYIKVYDLQRSEGLLLRHISHVYKALTQTVPDAAKNEELRAIETYLAAMLRQVDSSLLEQWERLQNPSSATPLHQPELRPPGADEAARDLTRDLRAFTALLRDRIFVFLRHVLNQAWDAALESLTDHDAGPDHSPWTPENLQSAFEAYEAHHQRFRLDPAARNIQHTYVSKDPSARLLQVEQILVDPEELNDWVVAFEVNLETSRALEKPALSLRAIRPVG